MHKVVELVGGRSIINRLPCLVRQSKRWEILLQVYDTVWSWVIFLLPPRSHLRVLMLLCINALCIVWDILDMLEYIIFVCPASQDTHPFHIGLLPKYLVVWDTSSWISFTLASQKIRKFSKLLYPKISLTFDGLL